MKDRSLFIFRNFASNPGPHPCDTPRFWSHLLSPPSLPAGLSRKTQGCGHSDMQTAGGERHGSRWERETTSSLPWGLCRCTGFWHVWKRQCVRTEPGKQKEWIVSCHLCGISVNSPHHHWMHAFFSQGAITHLLKVPVLWLFNGFFFLNETPPPTSLFWTHAFWGTGVWQPCNIPSQIQNSSPYLKIIQDTILFSGLYSFASWAYPARNTFIDRWARSQHVSIKK